MAALDFPASPTVGQTFNASNGVAYVWNGTIWVAASAPGASGASPTPPSSPTPNQLWFNSTLGQLFIWYDDGNSQQWVPASPGAPTATSPGGDFHARYSGLAYYVPTSGLAILFDDVFTGNTGNYYNPANGRWTPPAGKYYVFGQVTFIGTTPTASTGYIYLQKNATTNIATASVVVAGNGYSAVVPVSMEINANGTDFFTIVTNQSVASQLTQGGGGNSCYFGAFPISGVKGPPGDAGAGIGQTIKCAFGSGALGVGAWGTAGFTVVSNDTGVAPSSSTVWTPPAGRWAINAGFNFEGSAGATYILAFSTTSQRGYLYTPSNGFVGTATIFDVVDFNGSTPLGFVYYATLAGNAYSAFPHYWTAHKVK